MKKWQELCSDEAMIADGFNDAIIGVTLDGNLIYDIDKAVEVVCLDEGANEEDAMDYILYNCVGAYTGTGTPLWVSSLSGPTVVADE